MAKRPVLPDNYNPIGDRLKKATENPIVFQIVPESEKGVDTPQTPQTLIEEVAPNLPINKKLSELLDSQPIGKEIKESSIRFRCTANERKKWHSLSFDITQENGELSHIIRAALLLVENSYENLKKSKLEIQILNRPSRENRIGIVLYEQRLAEFIYEAIRMSGRPKW